MAKRTLVVGGTGLIGRAVVERLSRRGDAVFYVSRSPERDLQHGIPVRADIGRPGWAESLSQDFDGAALVYLPFSVTKDAKADRRINYLSLVEVVEAIAPSDIVFASSVSVFGANLPDGDVSETSPRVAHSPYARDKIDAETLLSSSAIKSTVLYITNAYAEDDTRTAYYKRILGEGYFVYRQGGQGLYNIVHADDVAQAVELSLARSGAIHESYVVNGETVTFRNWVSRVERVAKLGPKLRAPAFLVAISRGPIRRFGARFGVRMPMRLMGHKAGEFERGAIRYDSSRIRRALGWTPMHLIGGDVAGPDHHG